MPDEGVEIRVRTRGAQQSSREVRNVSGALRMLGGAGRTGAAGLGTIDRASSRAGVSLRQLGVIAAGWKVAHTLREAAGAGIQFNKVQDAQRVGFTTMLGSGEAAADMMARIQSLALRSPILDPASTGDAARSLLAFGIPLKDVLGDVERLGDMSAATGRSIAETMPLGARALGQIASKGKLSMEEMNQLAEGIGLGQTAIRKELGMTQEEFADTFRPGKAISASKALPAIRRAMEKQSKGAAKLMSETTAGQFDAARERFARRMGQLTRPAFDEAGDIVGSLSKELDHIAGRKDISLDEKLTLSQQAIRRKLEPVADELGDLWRRNHMGERLADGFETAVPFLADKAAAAAPRVAGAFVNAWWQAGPWGKLFAAALLAKKLGAFGLVGELAAGRFRQGFGRGTASRKASYQALGSRMGAWMGPAVGAAMTVGIALALQREFGDAVGDILGAPTEGKAAVDADPSVRKGRQMMRDQSIQRQMRRFNRDHPGLVDRMGPTHSRGELDTLLRLGYPGLIPGSPGVPKDYVPGRPYGARTRAPRARGSSQVIHTHVMLNGREIARATNRVNDNERAHNRRPPK